MRIPRIYHQGAIALNHEFALDDDAANHVGRVLRMAVGSELLLFNGDGFNYPARISNSDMERKIKNIQRLTIPRRHRYYP